MGKLVVPMRLEVTVIFIKLECLKLRSFGMEENRGGFRTK